MKRELKFIAWDGKRIIQNVVPTSKGNFGCWQKEGNEMVLLYSLKGKVMEFTGLKDSNDKDIYEDDVLSYTVFDHNDNDTQFKGVVNWVGSGFIVTQNPDVFSNGEYGIELFWVHNQDCELSVIGNIHENPELLGND